MVSPIGIICVVVWGIGWWLVLVHSIGLFSHHVPYRRNSWVVLSLVLSRLANEAVGWVVVFQLLLAPHVDFSFLAPPTF